MRLSGRVIVRAAVLSFVFSLLLVFMLAALANGLAASGVSVRAVQVVGFVVALVVRSYAAIVGARAARGEDLDRREVVVSSVVGMAAGFVVLELANSFTDVVLLGRQLTFRWDMLYGVWPWLLAGVLGGWFATRRPSRGRTRTRPSRPQY